MAQVANLVVKVSGDINDLTTKMSKAEKIVVQAAGKIKKAGEAMTLAITTPLLAMGGAFAKAAMDDAAALDKLTHVFGAGTTQMQAFIKETQKSIPATNDELMNLVGTTDAFLKQLGLAPGRAQAMTQTLTKLAGDIAAFNHTDIGSASDALDRALAGKAKGLMQFGIVINSATVKQEAYRIGIAKTGEALSQSQVAEATLALITEKSAIMRGESARQYDADWNASKRLKQATEELEESWGKLLLPTTVKIVDALTSMARKLTDVSDPMKNLAVGVGGVLVVGGPLLIFLGSAAQGIVRLQLAIKTLTGLEGLEGLGVALRVVGPVLIGLGAIATALYRNGAAAREASAEVARYASNLGSLKPDELIAKRLTVDAQLTGAYAQMDTLKAQRGPEYPAVVTKQGRDLEAKIRQQQVFIDKLTGYGAAIGSQYTVATMKPTKVGGTFGGIEGIPKNDPFGGLMAVLGPEFAVVEKTVSTIMRDNNMTISDTVDHAKLLTSAFDASTDKLKLFPLFLDQANAMAAKARETLERFPSPLQDANVEAHQLLNTLAPILQFGQLTTRFKSLGYNQTNPEDAFNEFGGFGATGTGAGGIGDASKVYTPIVGKLDTIGTIFKDAIASQAQFIAQSLTTVLGIKQANAGGAIGSVLGGAVGAGLGKAAIGATAGAIMGSVVPVVGTVIGSVVGSFIGNAIGGLFGGHKKAVDNSASSLNSLANAAQKVSEVLSNVPQGFDVALARFNANRAGSGYTAPGSSSSAPTFSGPVTIVANNPQQLYDQLTDYAFLQGARGGTGGLSVALA